MRDIRSVCVFCGAASRVDPLYHQAARDTGAAIAEAGWTLVYGGSKTGTMGSLADGALAAKGRVVGFIPHHLHEREQQHPGLTECHVVDSMHERKQRMVDSSDAFVVLPGGFGTLDEFFENITWRQLGLHDKPIVIVNLGGFWTHAIELIKTLQIHNFIREDHLQLCQTVDSVDQIVPALKSSPNVRFDPNAKWI